jgi:splicing factor U2AF subunit
MHLKPVSNSFKRELFRQMYEEHPEFKKRRNYSRSGSRKKSKKDKKHKKRSSRSRSRSRGNEKKRVKDVSRSNSGGGKRGEMNSIERRAMIAQWNNDDPVK